MTWEDFKYRYNHILYGLILGVIGVIIGFWIGKWYLSSDFFYPTTKLFDMMKVHGFTTDVLTLTVIPNVLFFYFLYFHWKMDETVKGVIFSTLMCVGLTLLLF